MKIDTTALADAFAANAAGVKKSSSDSDGGFGALLRHAETKQSEAAQELEKYVKMSPAERMVKAMMQRLGISQEQFNAMSPEQQAGVLKKITEMIQHEMEEKTAQQQQGSISL
jgi:predicted flavoprotein YhiN